MKPELPSSDQLLLDRFLDGMLTAEALADCRRRLEGEPALRAALQQRMRLRRGFVAGREAVCSPPADFASRVLDAARRLPPVAGSAAQIRMRPGP